MQKNYLFKALFLFVCAALITSCGENEKHKPPIGKPTGKAAHATLKPTKGSSVNGTVRFTELDDGVIVLAEVEGLEPGVHGFHIHEFGDCSAPDGKSAGDHFNPHGTTHAGPMNQPRHVGDLGNITANKKGKAVYHYVDYILKFEGPDSIIGKSVIVHKDPDDFTSQPTGNAGARLACGVIVEGDL
jgi:Cu-Zn family superoxide dismutase